MRFRQIAVTALVFLGVAVLLNSVHVHGGKVTKKKGGPVMKQSLTPLSPVRVVNVVGTPWVTVDWGLTLDANHQALYQNMATLLSGVAAVPQDRDNYYSVIINDVGSWLGMVSDVQAANGGGYVVTVSVSPLISPGSLYGDATGVGGDYSEIYHVDVNNNVTYSGFTDPEGMAGLPDDISVD